MPATLDQLLATQGRRHAHALIELSEDSGAVHRVHLRGGMVQAVELATPVLRFGEVLASEVSLPRTLLDHASRAAVTRQRRIGDVLVTCGLVLSRARDEALDRQRHLRLAYLAALRHTRVVVRASAPLPAGAAELTPLSIFSPNAERNAALELLGLTPRATRAEVVKAYRRLVRALHPDHNGGEVNKALTAVLDAYRLLSLSSPGI